MSALNRWVYRVSDGQLCKGRGPNPVVFLSDQVGYALVELPDASPKPDERTERVVHHATPELRTIRAATAQEIVAFDDALKDSQANAIDLDAVAQAVAQLDYEERQKLQVKAGQTLRTPAECRARVKAIYKSLL